MSLWTDLPFMAPMFSHPGCGLFSHLLVTTTWRVFTWNVARPGHLTTLWKQTIFLLWDFYSIHSSLHLYTVNGHNCQVLPWGFSYVAWLITLLWPSRSRFRTHKSTSDTFQFTFYCSIGIYKEIFSAALDGSLFFNNISKVGNVCTC